MAAYLDPANRAFADAAGKQQPLYEKTYHEARNVLEDIQHFEPADDMSIEKVEIAVQGEDVTTVIFRPVTATDALPMIYYTHGGGWILGRYVCSLAQPVCRSL